MTIEVLKMNPNQWVIKRKEKSYPIKTLEQLFVYTLAFDLKMHDIENMVVKMEVDQFNFARFENSRLKNMEKR